MPTKRIKVSRNGVKKKTNRGLFNIVDPREVAKSFKDFDMSPEIILGCIIMSGIRDTAEICRIDGLLANGVEITPEQAALYDSFKRIAKNPTITEIQRVTVWAVTIHEHFTGGLRDRFEWGDWLI